MKLAMDACQRAVAMPVDEIVVHGASWRKVLRKHAPLAARGQHVEDAVEHLTAADLALGRQQRFDDSPFLVRQIGRIAQPLALVSRSVLSRPHRCPRESPRLGL